jgi:hypothetical protein
MGGRISLLGGINTVEGVYMKQFLTTAVQVQATLTVERPEGRVGGDHQSSM